MRNQNKICPIPESSSAVSKEIIFQIIAQAVVDIRRFGGIKMRSGRLLGCGVKEINKEQTSKYLKSFGLHGRKIQTAK